MPGGGLLAVNAPVSHDLSYRINEVVKSNVNEDKMHQGHHQAGAKRIVIDLKVDDRKSEHLHYRFTPWIALQIASESMGSS